MNSFQEVSLSRRRLLDVVFGRERATARYRAYLICS
jgi:hypothetical protein